MFTILDNELGVTSEQVVGSFFQLRYKRVQVSSVSHQQNSFTFSTRIFVRFSSLNNDIDQQLWIYISNRVVT